MMITYSYHLNAPAGQLLSSGLGDITSDTPDLVLGSDGRVCEQGVDDRAALVASGTKNSDDLGHF